MNTAQHVAIIMDGNRRWARARDLEEIEGHRAGVDRLKEVVDEARELGIEYLTVWAFSTKNFNRSASFLRQIMMIFRETLAKENWWNELKEKQVRLQVIGNLDLFPKDIVQKIEEYLADTASDPKLTLTIALGYEGRDEIVRAIGKLLAENRQKIDIVGFERYLDTAGMPDPDLIIRTGGDTRLSGYLLWQMADAELYFCETLWPDFGKDDLQRALGSYETRERRFGK